eukprot:6184083-Pleurochrysis_carterae.AAC.1
MEVESLNAGGHRSKTIPSTKRTSKQICTREDRRSALGAEHCESLEPPFCDPLKLVVPRWCIVQT